MKLSQCRSSEGARIRTVTH